MNVMEVSRDVKEGSDMLNQGSRHFVHGSLGRARAEPHRCQQQLECSVGRNGLTSYIECYKTEHEKLSQTLTLLRAFRS